MKKVLNALMLVTILQLSSCSFGPSADTRLRIINATENDIYFCYSCDSMLYEHDTLGIKNNEIDKNDSIKAFGKLLGYNGWLKEFKRCKNKIYFYFFIDTIVDNHHIDSIKRFNIYTKKVPYTLEELEKSKWRIIYSNSLVNKNK